VVEEGAVGGGRDEGKDGEAEEEEEQQQASRNTKQKTCL